MLVVLGVIFLVVLDVILLVVLGVILLVVLGVILLVVPNYVHSMSAEISVVFKVEISVHNHSAYYESYIQDML